MAILGTWVDKHSVTRGGDANKGVTHGTAAHSLPATNAEFIWAAVRSLEGLGTGSGQGQLDVWVTGSNASLSTWSVRGAFSNASTPAAAFDIYSVVWHSLVR